MPYHNPTSSLFQGDTSHLHWARALRGSSQVNHARESTTDTTSPGTNSCGPCKTHEVISIDNLPVEILAEIFLHCPKREQRKFQFDPPADPRRRRAPLLLCQVSRYWREVALSLPLLWCSLSAACDGPFNPHPDFIELWLARSRGLPLFLHLEAPLFNNNPRYHSHASKMLDIYTKEIHRWRTISFVLDNNLARQFIATVDSRAQALEELELIFDDPNGPTAEASALLPSLSNLRKLSWSGNTSATSLRNIPFHQLTHFYIDSRSPAQDVINCLSQCTRVIKFYWARMDCEDWPSLCEFPQTTLLHLQSLNLQGLGDLVCILSRFTLPTLEHLCMRTTSRTQDHRMLEDFFDRSSCSLQQFILQDSTVHQESLVKYLSIPLLKTIPDIRIYLSFPKDILREMQEIKDSQDTPTFHRLRISYPECRWPALTWQ